MKQAHQLNNVRLDLDKAQIRFQQGGVWLKKALI